MHISTSSLSRTDIFVGYLGKAYDYGPRGEPLELPIAPPGETWASIEERARQGVSQGPNASYDEPLPTGNLFVLISRWYAQRQRS